MTELVKYEAARRALAEAVAVDEVTEIRSKAEAMRIYARQAGDRALEIQAAQIRFRAERRLGEMLIEQKETIGLNAGSRGQLKGKSDSGSAVTEQPDDDRPTLADVGIDRKLSSKAQKMAAIDAVEFEQALEQHAEEMRAGKGRVAMDLLKVGAEEKGRAHRRNLAAVLSEKTAELPDGQRFPAMYLDPPWKRQGGIGDRAYENHYPTMPWPEILDYLRRARDRLLPDAWAFMWIPRAHLLALVEFERELEVKATGELVTVADRVPLAWACSLALGMDSYSTCFVWTKTNDDHPDVSGSGLIAWDQDELLLLFKRGRGLPKPSGAEKFGSNHRERATDHSRKPEHYRRMIATMVGCDESGRPLPVLELFARVDADHPLPAGWRAAGNQAGAQAVAIADAVQSIEDPVSPLGLPSGGDVAAAADATLDGASPVAAVTDIPAFLPAALPAFPPTERADLQLFVELAKGDRAAAIAPDYLRRGLIEDWCGGWKLNAAGRVRLEIIERERAERARDALARLSADDFCEWESLSMVAAGEILRGEAVRDLVGRDLAHVTTTRVLLTDAGAARLAELEAMVDGARPAPALTATPYQLDLVQYLEGVK